MKRYCETCGEFIPKRGTWRWDYYGTRRFCDRACGRGDQPDITTDYTITDAGCWEWQGRVDRNGYGKAYDETQPAGQRVDWAHRISYRRHAGEIPAGHELDHTCRNTVCINPSHLEPVTRPEHALRTMERLGKRDRHLAAARLRSQGLTYGEIAEALGYASRSCAARAVARAIARGDVRAEDLPSEAS